MKKELIILDDKARKGGNPKRAFIHDVSDYLTERRGDPHKAPLTINLFPSAQKRGGMSNYLVKYFAASFQRGMHEKRDLAIS